MKVLMVNVVCGIRSTGRICTDSAKELEAQGHEVKIAYGREDVPEEARRYAVRIGTDWDVRLHGLRTRLFDAHGLGSKRATRKFLAWAEEYKPNLLWLHNIHGYYINYEMLFDWIKRHPEMQVQWTLHDCWAFTGHCSYFTFVGCEQWKKQCRQCVQKRRYPASFWFDSSKDNFIRKQSAFTGVKQMRLISPSKWLAGLVKQSFLKEYPIEVRHNTVDTSVFKPTPSDFRERYGLVGKKVVLGVASVWDERKGFDDFLKLAEILDDSYRIVLVGITKEQRKQLPGNIVGIRQTTSTKELAEIYTASDVFVNTSYEDNYPSVNLESQACGTSIITYDAGGCTETVQLFGSKYIRAGDIDMIFRCLCKI